MQTDLSTFLTKVIDGVPLKIILSNPKTDIYKYKKCVITLKGSTYHTECLTDKQSFHDNIKGDTLLEFIASQLEGGFTQLNSFDSQFEHSIRITKKNKVLYTKSKNTFALSTDVSHNRKKNYIIPDGIVVPPLVDMGVMTNDGKIINSMYDKYKQINRFIEMIDDCIKEKNITKLTVIDFGCGKSYLTFILYYYLTNIKNIDATIVGLDLKQDVIEKCNKTAQKYGYTGLSFELGDIKGYHCDFSVDMVISLHACDVATDFALFNAISWGARMIFSVPCCQHELNEQISGDDIITRYGIVKERICALYTDSIRANLLCCCGYKAQLLEFIDFSHTPKNILIRAVKSSISKSAKDKNLAEVESLMEQYGLSPTLYNLLKQNNII